MIPVKIQQPSPHPTMEQMQSCVMGHIQKLQDGLKDIIVAGAHATTENLKGLPEAIKEVAEASKKPPQITLPPLEIKIRHEIPPEQKGFMEVAKQLGAAISEMNRPKPAKNWLMEVDRDRNGMIRTVKAKQV